MPSNWFCDDYADCADRSDELRCCPDTQFNCDNGRCIEWDSWCDGNNDCRDNSDEDECVGKLMTFIPFDKHDMFCRRMCRYGMDDSFYKQTIFILFSF